MSGPLVGPARKSQGPARGALDPWPAAFTTPSIGRRSGLASRAVDAADLAIVIEAEVAYTPGRVALGAAKPQLSPIVPGHILLTRNLMLPDFGNLLKGLRGANEVLPGGEPRPGPGLDGFKSTWQAVSARNFGPIGA